MVRQNPIDEAEQMRRDLRRHFETVRIEDEDEPTATITRFVVAGRADDTYDAMADAIADAGFDVVDENMTGGRESTHRKITFTVRRAD